MHLALTGGTGFIGRHLAHGLREEGHSLTILARGVNRTPSWMSADADITVLHGSVADPAAIVQAVEGADVVGHLAGINYERGTQTYRAIHERGTANVLRAADDSGIERILLLSYLRARPGTASGYFASKWRAERLCRASDVPTTIVKPAGVFGPGDQLLTNLIRWLRTVPVLPIPAGASPMRPVAVEDVVRIAIGGLNGHLQDETVAVMGPETLSLPELAKRVARAIDRHVYTIPTPPALLRIGGRIQERVLDDPIVTRASAAMLAEGMVEAEPAAVCESLPTALTPEVAPTEEYIREHIDATERLGLEDLAFP